MREAQEIAVTAISTALVAITTMGFTIVIPETKGYFNLGEAMVYLVAFLFGPKIGAIAGGLGSMIADLILAPIYAPATLAIKSIEGFLVGYLSKLKVKRKWGLLITAALAFAIGFAGIYVFTQFYSGLTMVTFFQASLTVNLTPIHWVIIILAFLLLYTYMNKHGSPSSLQLFSALVGGGEMVLGYLIYESFLFGAPAALVEIPFNIGQVLIGCMISIPLYAVISRSGVIEGI